MGRVDGKVAVISGGARGMGAAHARMLVAEGAKVVIGDILDDEGKALAERLTALGPGAMEYWHLDVSSAEEWAALAAHLDGGPVHGLVNNAGVPYRARLLTMDLAGWERVIGINLTGAMLGMRAIVPLMPDNDGASIVNIGSIAGLTAHFALAYTVSKWGLRGLTKAAALELAPRGIRVNIVHPGPIDTPILDDERRALIARERRTMQPADEVGEAVVGLLTSGGTGEAWTTKAGRPPRRWDFA